MKAEVGRHIYHCRQPPAQGGPAASPGGVSRQVGVSAPEKSPRRRRLSLLFRLALLALLALLACDLLRAPADQLSARALIVAIHLYQANVSEHLAALGVRCRFRPTCSHYAEGAIAKYGALAGSARAVWRVARCGPWTPAGTFDPP
ncbi:MAG TPA: membrane protein insertion efficiency factor YidD [Thermoanaerobaculia bacterium]|nr:membrane protein insertion efficiency factor YidD [Thermoanaerobaculia bacterium]